MRNSILAWWIRPAVVIHSWKDPEVTIHTNVSVLERKFIILFTFLGNKLGGHPHLKRGKHRGMVTRHYIICTTLKKDNIH